jgi:hypothetical protein
VGAKSYTSEDTRDPLIPVELSEKFYIQFLTEDEAGLGKWMFPVVIAYNGKNHYTPTSKSKFD